MRLQKKIFQEQGVRNSYDLDVVASPSTVEPLENGYRHSDVRPREEDNLENSNVFQELAPGASSSFRMQVQSNDTEVKEIICSALGGSGLVLKHM